MPWLWYAGATNSEEMYIASASILATIQPTMLAEGVEATRQS